MASRSLCTRVALSTLTGGLTDTGLPLTTRCGRRPTVIPTTHGSAACSATTTGPAQGATATRGVPTASTRTSAVTTDFTGRVPHTRRRTTSTNSLGSGSTGDGFVSALFTTPRSTTPGSVSTATAFRLTGRVKACCTARRSSCITSGNSVGGCVPTSGTATVSTTRRVAPATCRTSGSCLPSRTVIRTYGLASGVRGPARCLSFTRSGHTTDFSVTVDNGVSTITARHGRCRSQTSGHIARRYVSSSGRSAWA